MPPRTTTFVAPARAGRAAAAQLRRTTRLQGGAPATRILGLDPGLHRTGYGLIELRPSPGSGATPLRSSSAHPVLIEGGIIRARATDALAARLETLHRGLTEVLREHRPEVVVLEDLFSTYAHPRSALLMAHARGALMLAAQQAGLPVYSFLPNEVKQVIAGNGHASKASVQAAVRARLRLTAILEPPDVADALAIALCFAARQEISERVGEPELALR